jgi:MerR family transcriptional regulator, heat shock protein HspR
MKTDDTGNRPRYVISIAAEMLGTQPYTLRYYERVGIISPARSRGNVRLYSESDIDLIKRAMSLINDLGVNLAGVEVILHMSRQIMELQEARIALEQELEKLRQEEI